MRYFFLLSFVFVLFSCQEPNSIFHEKVYHLSTTHEDAINDFLMKNQSFNQETVFFLDFSLTSNKERFFVVDMVKDSITHRGLVTHGSCNGSTATKGDQYSNVESSYCSSLGKYKIGHDYQGKFGLAYKLHGLEESNSNAFNRFIVLHSHGCVPNEAVNYPICLSQGCPTVSPTFLSKLAEIIDESKQPILLWMIDER